MPYPMTYSDACVALVKQFEGLYLTAYRCPASVLTIGWGHTGMVREGQQISEEQAEAFLQDDLGYGGEHPGFNPANRDSDQSESIRRALFALLQSGRRSSGLT